MFGKTKDDHDSTLAGLFGDEQGAAQVARLDTLHDRVDQVEAQVRSQFTSMAAYAQIAQEQIDLARAESRAESERTEHRLIQLIERERADRIDAIETPYAPTSEQAGAAVTDLRDEALSDELGERLGQLEHRIEQLAQSIERCFDLQRTLAEAIAAHFAHSPLPRPTAQSDHPAMPSLPPPPPGEVTSEHPIIDPLSMPRVPSLPVGGSAPATDGPIDGLSLLG